MRLIDGDKFEAFLITPPDGYSDEQLEAYHAGATLVLEKIDEAHTINPEELPVVLNLRAALANVTVQRNAAARDCAYAIRNTGFGCCYCLYGKNTKYGARVDYECTYEGKNKHGCMPKWRGRDW